MILCHANHGILLLYTTRHVRKFVVLFYIYIYIYIFIFSLVYHFAFGNRIKLRLHDAAFEIQLSYHVSSLWIRRVPLSSALKQSLLNLSMKKYKKSIFLFIHVTRNKVYKAQEAHKQNIQGSLCFTFLRLFQTQNTSSYVYNALGVRKSHT